MEPHSFTGSSHANVAADAKGLASFSSLVELKFLDTSVQASGIMRPSSSLTDPQVLLAANTVCDWARVSAAQYLVHKGIKEGKREEEFGDLNRYDMAGWILLCLKMRAHNMPLGTATASCILSDQAACNIISEALSVPNFVDLKSACGAHTGPYDPPTVVNALVCAVRNERAAFIDLVAIALDQVIAFEEDESIVRRMERMSKEHLKAWLQ